MRFFLRASLFLVCGFAPSLAAAEGPDFEKAVAPLIVRRCLGCHNASEAKGGLVLTTREGMLRGGESGTALVPGKPDESHLLDRVEKGEMPPEDKGKSKALPKAETELLKSWIAAGANWPEKRLLSPYEATSDQRAGRDWWSLQPIKRPTPPASPGDDASASPIDAFLQARLDKEGLTSAPPAKKRTLLRRVYIDLIGLPPTAEEVEQFERDDSAGAYEAVVDRLLASPHFGERWARYWLDLVRFAETNGYERDAPKPHAWRYRDYVVQSFNEDKPYDRFVREQLAGDELPDRSEQTVIATGLLRLGTWDDEPNDALEYKYERLEDLVHVTSTAFLGLSVKCARCHDHKFDPIPQTDYYRLGAAFWAGFIEPRDRPLAGGPSVVELGFDVLGWTDRGREPPPLHLLKKGDPRRPADLIEPAQLSVVATLDKPLNPPPVDSKTSRRRLQVADWIVDPANPLTARVIVNRLWQQHFGEGLVRSPNNFGFKGELPTHPELLDWLAGRLFDGGWKLKALHKEMVMSRAYRQASLHPQQAEYSQRDFTNKVLWRANRRRLDAESMRDAMLAASGQLDRRLGGPSFFPSISSEALEGLSRKDQAWKASPPAEQRRRSLYIFTQRSLLVPLLTTFDFADTTQPCGQRDVTTVAPQALALLNNQFVHEQSAALAQRVVAASPDDRRAQIAAAWKLAFSRDPSSAESVLALEHLDAQQKRFAARKEVADKGPPEVLALTSLCHVLLNANEFVYVD